MSPFSLSLSTQRSIFYYYHLSSITLLFTTLATHNHLLLPHLSGALGFWILHIVHHSVQYSLVFSNLDAWGFLFVVSLFDINIKSFQKFCFYFFFIYYLGLCFMCSLSSVTVNIIIFVAPICFRVTTFASFSLVYTLTFFYVPLLKWLFASYLLGKR